MTGTYTTESHLYRTTVKCADPATCTENAHWEDNDNECATVDDARDAAQGDDADATRIVEIRDGIRTVLEVVTPTTPWRD